MGHSAATEQVFVESQLVAARAGRADAYYELGLVYSIGQHGVDIDLVEAHKWFNLAALAGMHSAQEARAELAAEMSAVEIAEAQRQARAWLGQVSH